jgi:putative restriction endonuclease
LVRRRLHQRAFRERVLAAYRRECAFCRFRHEELLDAAHIIADADPMGEPHVSNGLALCRLHHAAFDRYFVGVRPDLRIEVRQDLLSETDGPTLVHGIQSLHGTIISVPRFATHRPDTERLEQRFAEFVRREKAS